jgi:hypothetical protein
MSKCDLSIELESRAVRYQPGDVVRGHVLVDVDAECACKKLNIVLQWRTHGRGNPAKGEPLKQTLFEGAWRSGEQLRHPFEFTLPAGPLSYHGEVLNVDWYINATADIPWTLDPKAEIEIFVHRGSYTGPLSVVADQKYQQSEGSQAEAVGELLSRSQGAFSKHPELFRYLTIGAFVVLGPIICIGIATALFSFLKVQKAPSEENIILLVIGSAFIVVPAIILVFFLRWLKMRRKLGNIQVATEAMNTDTGTKIFCAVTFKPQATLVVNRISANLVGQEIVIHGSGEHQVVCTEEFHREGKELISGQQLIPGNPVEEIVEFDLPADAPPTFLAHSNRLIWTVHVKVDIPGWPDYNEKVEIIVPPDAFPTA